MMLGTHAALPVIGVTLVETIQLMRNKERILTNWQLFFIGVGGILPDILWPHMRLSDRLNSPTHTVWFVLILIPLIYWIAKKAWGKNVWSFTLFFTLAAALHIATDAVSGGVAPFLPIKDVYSMRLISFHYWFWADGILLITMSLLIVVRNGLKRKAIPVI